MKIVNNFSSAVALGSFNPAILTPDFVSKKRIYAGILSSEPQASPILSQLEYGEVSILVELERIQVMHKNVADFEKSAVVKIISRYLSILRYTPVAVEGINFNVSFMDYSDAIGLESIFADPIENLPEYLDVAKEYLFDIQFKVSPETKEVNTINVKYSVGDGISRSANFRKIRQMIILNFNYEVALTSDAKNQSLVHDSYLAMCGSFKDLTKKLAQ